MNPQSQLTIQSLAQAEMPQADRDRKLDMQNAWKAYRGNLQKPLKVSANQPDDNVLSNRCAPIVDKGVSFLFGQVLKIEAEDDVANEYLKNVWGDDDDRMTMLSQLAMNGGVCGQVFVKVILPTNDQQYPRLVVLDPTVVRVVTMPEDCEMVLAYIIEYPQLNNTFEKRQIISRVDPDGMADDIGVDDMDSTWTIINYVRRSQGGNGSWFQVGEIEEWPYPFPPIITCQNLPNPNEYWGTPDLTPDIIDMNRVLNFIQSNTSRILKFHAHPKTYASGVGAAQINVGVDELICLPNPEAKLNNLEMHTDLGSSLNFASVLRSDMDEQSRVPAVALGRLSELPKGNISGVALQLLFQPLLEKTVQKQRLYGRLIREVSRVVLVIGKIINIERFAGYGIELHWQNLLPVDDLAAAQTGLALKQLGVSQQTILLQLGYNPDDEADKSQQEDAQKLMNWNRGQGMPPMIPPVQQQSQQQSPFIGR